MPVISVFPGGSGTSSDVAVGNVTNMSAVAAGNGKLSVKWTDPDSTVVDKGSVVATWAKTIVVVKKGSAATSPDDTGAVRTLTSNTHNAHTANGLLVDGLENGTEYYVSFFPVTTDNVVNTNAANQTKGTPNRFVISTTPTQNGALSYNGSAQIPVWNNYDKDQLILRGETVGENAGTYNATFTPKDDYCWLHGSSGDDMSTKIVQWTIGQIAGTMTVSPVSIELDNDHLSETLTISGNYDGKVSVEFTSGGDIFEATPSDKAIIVKSKNYTSGSGAIIVKCVGCTNYTTPADVSVSITAKFVPCYGVKWDGTSNTKLSRTDMATEFTNPVPAINNGAGSSPFDDIMPWSGIVRESDDIAGELVKIPKFWYKLAKSGNELSIRIANQKTEGYSVSPAHMARNEEDHERDYVYIGRYHCASGYKSATGVKPLGNITRSTARAGIKALGNGIYQMDFAMRFTIWLLYIVEFADWNSQTAIGYGCGNNSSTEVMGYTDDMEYHTGTTLSSRTTYGVSTQYRYIEGLWDNVFDWMDGCFYSAAGLSIVLDPEKFTDETGSEDAKVVGMLTGGYPSVLDVSDNGGFPMFYPTKSSGSTTTYIPDNWGFYSSNPCLCCGGSYYRNLGHGLFYVDCVYAAGKNAGIGCRLQKLP